MIQVFGNGRLGKDAEFKQLNDTLSVASFSIAVNKMIKGEKVTEWYNCSMFNPKGLIDYLKSGQEVVISGEMQQRKHEDKYYYSIICHRVELIGSKKESSVQQEQPEQPKDDLPF